MLVMLLARFSTLETLILITPLPIILYVTFRHALGRVQDQITHLGKVSRVYVGAIEALAHAVDAKDQVTHDHTRRVQDQAESGLEALVDRRSREGDDGATQDRVVCHERRRRQSRTRDLLEDEPKGEGDQRHVHRDRSVRGEPGLFQEHDRPGRQARLRRRDSGVLRHQQHDRRMGKERSPVRGE
jgi:hypothetical protein